MKKIAILGCENSHADQFLGFIRDDARYSDLEVVGVYSVEPAAAERLAEKYGVPILPSPDAAAGRVDGLIVTARDGRNHYPYAAPYLPSGIPVFLDKPITSDEGEAVRLMRACRQYGVRLTGGSSCVHIDEVQDLRRAVLEKRGGETLGGVVRGPIDLHNSYGGFWFYAQHVTEILCEIYGRFPKTVVASPSEDGGKITVLFRYPAYTVTALFTEGCYVYSAERFSEAGNEGGVFPVTGESPCFRREFHAFYELLSGGAPRLREEELIAPVFVMDAIARSMKSRKEEVVHPIIL